MTKTSWILVTIIFALFWLVPVFSNVFFGIVDAGMGLLGVDPFLPYMGLANFRFWIHQ